MKKFFVPLLFAATMLVACDKNESDPTTLKAVKLNESFTLKINQTAEIASDGMKITFLDVTEDSRCPKYVSCIWEGRAVVEFKVEKDGKSVIKSATTNPQQSDGSISTGFEAFGHVVTLEELTPYPEGSTQIKKSEYKAKITVE